ncbi:hypothetical protein KVT40_007302 [Elsinoe batatas]|uniref:Uncharacterized protein n=1 Tax=Elsinoe batatas TaxID=2601811 RepID=A0A8K0KYI3_9PEZI|nr:hypothetical protein KVT40_007302 [Elsinoe batatas]
METIVETKPPIIPSSSVISGSSQTLSLDKQTMDSLRMPASSLLALLYPLPHILLTIYLVPLLPYPSLTLALSAYAALSLFASMLGLFGLRLRSPTFLFIFSHHLMLDVFLSLIPQLTLLAVFHNFAAGGDVCPTVYDGMKSYGKFRVPSSEVPFAGMGKLIGLGETNWCQLGLQAVQAIAATLVVIGGVAQWRAALGVRRLAIWYEMTEKVAAEEEEAECGEKEGLLTNVEEK